LSYLSFRAISKKDLDLAWSLEQSRRCKLLLVAVFFPDAYRALKDFEDRPGFETLERFEAELEKLRPSEAV